MRFLKKLFGNKKSEYKGPQKPIYELSKAPLRAPEMYNLEWIIDDLSEGEKIYLGKVIDLMNESLFRHSKYLFISDYSIERLKNDKNYLYATYFEILVFNLAVSSDYFKKKIFSENLENALFEIIANQFSMFHELIMKTFYDEDETLSYVQDIMYDKQVEFEKLYLHLINNQKSGFEAISLFEKIIEEPFNKEFNQGKRKVLFQEKAKLSYEFIHSLYPSLVSFIQGLKKLG